MHIPFSWFWIFASFLFFAALTVYLAPQAQPYAYLRYISASIIVLFLPGFAFTKMLFPDWRGLGYADVAALSLGVSLALTPLTALVLNYASCGLKEGSVLALLSVLTILFAAIALVRQRFCARQERPSNKAYRRTSFGCPEAFLFALPFVLAVCLRVYPFLISGLPFSVDAWPSIKYAEVLLERSPVRLEGELLGSCDELGDRLFGAAISALTGLKPLRAMAFFLPLAGATSILMLYALVREIYGERASFLASMLLATAFTDIILTAGVKGETYAHPLYMLLILLFLHEGMVFWKRILLFSMVGASLVLTHYYTAMLTATILASMGIATLISRWKVGARLGAYSLILPSILSLQVLAYLTIYAKWAFMFISSIDWISAASYQLVSFASALYLAFKPSSSSRKRTPLTCVVASIVAFTLAFLATRRPLVPGAPVLPSRYLLYASPLIIAAPLSVLGHGASKSVKNCYAVLPLFWLATVLGLEGFAIFGNVEPGLGLTLAYRGVNFLLPPFFILCAIGF
ncbi:DUF1616 domain-containing protein, partial [Candidatus Bathyarchaeota archaeon]|nr:DUF1616 domain-containing protein [Candidatus Bathyarchaeota archaeon]